MRFALAVLLSLLSISAMAKELVCGPLRLVPGGSAADDRILIAGRQYVFEYALVGVQVTLLDGLDICATFDPLSQQITKIWNDTIRDGQDLINYTVSGREYVLSSSDTPKKLQPAYRDSQGLLWGSPMKDVNGKHLQLTLGEAKKMCGQQQDSGGRVARLPTIREAIRLHLSMSRQQRMTVDTIFALLKSGVEFTDELYYPILPALPELHIFDSKYYQWFWSDDEDGITVPYGGIWVLSGKYGTLAPLQATSQLDSRKFAVRCVMDL